jgi:inosose dehydratase
VGICIDTGHSAYAGIDPAAMIRRYGSRVRHMHFKDIDPAVREACLAGHVDFFAAVARQIFCPLGEGMVDFAGVRKALADIGYAGLIVVEQDVDPAGDASPADNAKASFRFLASAGMAPPRVVA